MPDQTTEPQAAVPWRQGRRVPVNVYDGDRPVFQAHTVEDAELAVSSVNFRREFEESMDLAGADARRREYEANPSAFKPDDPLELLKRLGISHPAEDALRTIWELHLAEDNGRGAWCIVCSTAVPCRTIQVVLAAMPDLERQKPGRA